MRGRSAIPMLSVVAASLAAATAAHAASHPRSRVETPVHSSAADARIVKESYVSLYAPLPEADGSRPPRCDRIGYLRFRDAKGPRRARKASAVFVTMPGIFAGASSLDIFARNVVRTARAHGRHVEVWTLDRRSNCLEDHWGTERAARAHDYRIALNYYYHGAKAGKRRFAGFKSEGDASFLKGVGLEQTVQDEYRVIRQLPRKVRQRKVFCGGHSLGGPLTAAFADWDLDGNPETTRDAGYKQCAGFFALDTRLDLGNPGSGGGSSGGGGSSSVGLANAFAQASGGSPYINAPPFTPETIQAVPPTALAAFQAPRAESKVITLLPHDANFEATFRTLFSRDAVNAATQMPSVRDFRTTNETALGATFDDNSSPVTILRTSLGTYAGGPVAEKSWPIPYGQPDPSGTGLFDGKHLMVPTAPHGPLYRWWPFNQFGKPGTPHQVDDSGQPYTTKVDEVTSIHQFARSIYDAPADFVEQYFPTRLLTDQEDAGGGDRSGSLQNLRYDGIPKHPQFYGDAQHGIEEGADPPPKARHNAWIVLRGYNHIDVATAALRQNTGKHEAESARIWKWARALLGG